MRIFYISRNQINNGLGSRASLGKHGRGDWVRCALALESVLDSLLFGVSARDPLTLIGVGAITVVTAVLASLPSVRRATGADPVISLRAE